jgi:ABC-type uncharacterized transport system permease subunit
MFSLFGGCFIGLQSAVVTAHLGAPLWLAMITGAVAGCAFSWLVTPTEY